MIEIQSPGNGFEEQVEKASKDLFLIMNGREAKSIRTKQTEVILQEIGICQKLN